MFLLVVVMFIWVYLVLTFVLGIVCMLDSCIFVEVILVSVLVLFVSNFCVIINLKFLCCDWIIVVLCIVLVICIIVLNW